MKGFRDIFWLVASWAFMFGQNVLVAADDLSKQCKDDLQRLVVNEDFIAAQASLNKDLHTCQEQAGSESSSCGKGCEPGGHCDISCSVNSTRFAALCDTLVQGSVCSLSGTTILHSCAASLNPFQYMCLPITCNQPDDLDYLHSASAYECTQKWGDTCELGELDCDSDTWWMSVAVAAAIVCCVTSFLVGIQSKHCAGWIKWFGELRSFKSFLLAVTLLLQTLVALIIQQVPSNPRPTHADWVMVTALTASLEVVQLAILILALVVLLRTLIHDNEDKQTFVDAIASRLHDSQRNLFGNATENSPLLLSPRLSPRLGSSGKVSMQMGAPAQQLKGRGGGRGGNSGRRMLQPSGYDALSDAASASERSSSEQLRSSYSPKSSHSAGDVVGGKQEREGSVDVLLQQYVDEDGDLVPFKRLSLRIAWVYYITFIVAFAGIYIVATLLVDQTYLVSLALQGKGLTLYAEVLYLSTSTQTLEGFSDIANTHFLPDLLSNFQMMIGMFFGAIIIAQTNDRLVTRTRHQPRRIPVWLQRLRRVIRFIRRNLLVITIFLQGADYLMLYFVDENLFTRDQVNIWIVWLSLFVQTAQAVFVVASTYKFVKHADEVTLDFLFQAFVSCALSFAGIYIMMTLIDTTDLAFSYPVGSSKTQPTYWEIISYFIYFAFTVQTTAGVGDMFPRLWYSRLVVCVHMLVAVLFGVVVLGMGLKNLSSVDRSFQQRYTAAGFERQNSAAQEKEPEGGEGRKLDTETLLRVVNSPRRTRNDSTNSSGPGGPMPLFNSGRRRSAGSLDNLGF